MKPEDVFALDSAGWPALLVDASGAIYRANPAAVSLFGPAFPGDSPHLAAVWSPENSLAAGEFLAHWERTPVPITALKFRGKGGHTFSHLTSVCAFTKDSRRYFVLQLLPGSEFAGTEARPAGGETGLAQKQKLDCALQLARTVALDFNNALTSILGHTSLVLSKMEPSHPWRGSLIEVEKSAAKAAEIANDLGTFSRQEKETRSQATGNLNRLLQRSVEFFQQNAGPEPVTWTLQLDRKLFAAKFEEAKMQQAFMKLFENAVQALREGGRISVQTRNIELAEPTQDRNVQLAAGAYVSVEISDNGCGIEPEVLPRVFEPFFTTKRGSHRGLGLAWVYGIVTNHSGGVAISSRPGEGTSVRIYLPAERQTVRDDKLTADDLSGSQTILIVDDEELLLTMGKTILSAYGYRVLTANGGPKALELLSRKDSAVDLVITDLVMPTMSGRELVEQIRKQWPAMRIICTSGYVWPAGQANDATYLQKPFTSQELLLKVKHVLGTEPGSG
ncbi:MAG TPA: ATP-binding protein [Candidatus Paceibacterota bacterium]|nr:ATP-binding protein [Verrucomicrobiota bacterium]HSA12891.1 ATP-binding protein [Candidatus Paceibacterota bacterium]